MEEGERLIATVTPNSLYGLGRVSATVGTDRFLSAIESTHRNPRSTSSIFAQLPRGTRPQGGRYASQASRSTDLLRISLMLSFSHGTNPPR